MLLACLAGAAALCGCTVVIGRPPAAAPPLPTATAEAIVLYPTPMPTWTATAAPSPTATAVPPTATATTAATDTPVPTDTPTPEPFLVHTVVQGDTLLAIARAYGVPLDAVVAANGIEDPSRLAIGQELRIPQGEAPLPPTPAPTVSGAATPTPPAPPEAPPTPEPPSPTATPAASPPRVSETTVTLNICDYEPALYPLRPEQVGYPYDGLDFEKVGPPAPRQYRALLLENAYLRLTILPDLGGRIYQIEDKASGTPLLYNNPAIIASNWGTRGWWLAVGGVEWALPTDEHGLAEYLPWSAATEQSDEEAAVVLSFEERLTGVRATVRVALDAHHAYVKVTPRLSNPGEGTQKLQFWSNAMYAPGGLSVPPATRIALPAAQALVHSTGDPGLPPAGQPIPWPIYGTRDLSLLSDWRGYLGAFAHPRASQGFLGAQVPGAAGLMRVFPPDVAQGAKFFGLGDIPYSRYSAGESSYLELWVGWSPTFWHYQSLAPGQAVEWQEVWYALPDMPPVAAANADVALALSLEAWALTLTAEGEVEIDALDGGGNSVRLWRAALAPGQVWRADSIPAGVSAIEVRLAQDRRVLMRWPK